MRENKYYTFINEVIFLTRLSIEKYWSREKYRVMFHSQHHYNLIRQAMRNKEEPDKIEKLIHSTFLQKPTEGSMRNACEHMWGYFKRVATNEEKNKYFSLLQQNEYRSLLKYLSNLSNLYKISYLQESTILKNVE